jgi:DNA-binding NarL/FixJ family response regulator
VNDQALVREGRLRLTARERDVLELLARGLRHEKIASQLGIGSETVRSHVRNAAARLGAANSTQAVAVAIRRGLIQS